MSNMNVSEAQKNLYKIVKMVNQTHQPIEITGKDGSAVVIGEADWRGIQETLHLTSIPGMRESILEGMKAPLDTLAKKLDW